MVEVFSPVTGEKHFLNQLICHGRPDVQDAAKKKAQPFHSKPLTRGGHCDTRRKPSQHPKKHSIKGLRLVDGPVSPPSSNRPAWSQQESWPMPLSTSAVPSSLHREGTGHQPQAAVPMVFFYLPCDKCMGTPPPSQPLPNLQLVCLSGQRQSHQHHKDASAPRPSQGKLSRAPSEPKPSTKVTRREPTPNEGETCMKFLEGKSLEAEKHLPRSKVSKGVVYKEVPPVAGVKESLCRAQWFKTKIPEDNS
nr:uncharacterized protein LOC110083200 isoform X1 [Pogona vitticeps]